MSKFIVMVSCAAHLTHCPIPNGYKGEFVAKDKATCESKARGLIAAFGYATAAFVVKCAEPK